MDRKTRFLCRYSNRAYQLNKTVACQVVIPLAMLFTLCAAVPSLAGDLADQAPLLADPATTAENSVVIDPLYYETLCDFSSSTLWDDWNLAGPVGIASVAKVMTYALALDAVQPGLDGFDTTPSACVSIASDAVENVPAMMNPPLQQGWSAPLDILLHGMMKRSSNGAAKAIGKFVSDGIAGETLDVADAKTDFLARMNDRAADLAMPDTTYCSRSGSSISTPEDQFRLWLEASQHPLFYDWVAPGSAMGFDCSETVNFINNTRGDGGVIGMQGFKDGNQGTSGPGSCSDKPTCTDCLIAESERLDRTLLSFQHKGPNGSASRWPDAQALFNYGFEKLFTPDLRASAASDTPSQIKAQAIDTLSSRAAVSATVGTAPGGDELRVCGWGVNADAGTASQGACTSGGPIAAIGGAGGMCSMTSKMGVDAAFVRMGRPPRTQDGPGNGGTSKIQVPMLATAVTNPASQTSQLRVWTVIPSPPHTSSPLGAGVEFPGDQVIVHRLGGGIFLTVYNECGALKIESWKMDGFGSLSRLDSARWDAGSVTEHAVTHGEAIEVGGTQMIPFVTPIRLGTGEIRLGTWQLNSSTGKVVFQQAPLTSYQGSELSGAPTNLSSPVPEDRYYTLSYARDNNVRLDSAIFQVVADGTPLEVSHTSMAAAAGAATGTHILPLGDLGLATAVRTSGSDGKLRLIVWEPRQDQASPTTAILRVADEKADDLLPGVSLYVDDGGLDFRPLYMDGNPAEADYLTSRLSNGVLHLDVWRIGPRPDSADSLCCGNGIVDPGEQCDMLDFDGLSCGALGFDMGSLTCNPLCQVDTDGCENSEFDSAPASYGDCGFSTESCAGDPSECGGDGTCVGGPCKQTDPSDRSVSSLLSPLNLPGEFHPDGNFRDHLNNLYYCHDGAQETVCIEDDSWGVCTPCGQGENETMIGCTCTTDEQCGTGLSCFGEDIGNSEGICQDAIEGPPLWQCDQGTCGQVPWFLEDEMYCEHYPVDGGKARCEPAHACDGPTAQTCAAEGVICAPPDVPEEGEEWVPAGCTYECLLDEHCSEANGWPNGYSCVATDENLSCQYTG